jgi:ketosteroid isomerase-like protein
MTPVSGGVSFVDKDKKLPKQPGFSLPDSQAYASDRGPGSAGADSAESGLPAEMQALLRKLQPEMRRPRPTPDALAAALEAAQRLAAEGDAEQAADDVAQQITRDQPAADLCPVCGYRNRGGNKFCGMCGLPVAAADRPEEPSFAEENSPSRQIAPRPSYSEPEREPRSSLQRTPGSPETHHYHHHYHHHYFPGGQEGFAPSRAVPDPAREAEKFRASPVLRGESMSRAEAAVRRVTQDWVLACNTKHLDDLLELYIADAMVLRSNYAIVRGAAAVREFFFGALDAGLGEVEVEPIRVELAGDLAYEAGRCKALIPGAAGKRREERGKYLWVLARQPNGEWKLAVDCWSSDLSLTTLESDVPSRKG